jgi:hypothetical protein
MWLQLSDTIDHVLAERQLEPVSDDPLSCTSRDTNSSNPVQLTPQDIRQMTTVAIGYPQTQTLQEIYSPNKVPRAFRSRLKQADFYVVYLSCSFRPINKECRVEWARFRATLLPQTSTGTQPLALDIYPQQVVQEIKKQVKVTLSPALKFLEIEANIGNVAFGFEYTEQIPMISASIGTSFDPSWDYRAGPGHEVLGTKHMFLLLEAPKGLTNAQVLLDLEADVLIRGARFPVTFWRRQEQAAPQLTAPLWG